MSRMSDHRRKQHRRGGARPSTGRPKSSRLVPFNFRIEPEYLRDFDELARRLDLPSKKRARLVRAMILAAKTASGFASLEEALISCLQET